MVRETRLIKKLLKQVFCMAVSFSLIAGGMQSVVFGAEEAPDEVVIEKKAEAPALEVKAGSEAEAEVSETRVTARAIPTESLPI